MAQAAPNPIQLAQQNYANRQALIQTGLHMIKKLQPQTGSMGGSIRIPLERIGIMTGIMLQIDVPVNVTVAATQSAFGPYNLITKAQYTDYAGVNRIDSTGVQLHELNCFRGHMMMNNSAKNAGYLANSETGIDTNILHFPTGVAADTISFSLYLPCAYDAMTDLRGAVLSQTIYGDHYVTLNLASALVGSDSLVNAYTAGTVAANGSVTVTAYQHYIMPQGGVNNLPVIDLSTIYAIEGGYQSSDNIAAGQSKYINWPNNRAIMSALHIFDNGGTPVTNGTDVSQIVLMANSNTNLREMNPRYLRNHMRSMVGSDFPAGVYYISSRTQPITTQLYGNVQTRFDVATANAGAYFLSQFESVYMAGTPLPGVVQ